MLCLEVTVNGESYCVVGRDDALVGAGLSRDVDLSRRTPRMKVSAVSLGPAGFEQWGAEECFLKLGDVVTVRVVEREAADSPKRRSTVTAPFRPAPPELFTNVSGGLEGELFLWVWLIVGTAVILLFG
jgi:hypothetical protein